MSDGTVICRRCGVANTAGDQFCGSCGAFLEWEGDPAAAAAPTSSSPPTPPATPPAPPPEQRTATPGVVCPSCGTANPDQRTFCNSCGTDLRAANRSGGLPLTATAGSRPPASSESGGMPFWLPIVAVVGLLAGVGFVVATIVMRPTPVPPGATANPSVTFTPTLPPSPATSPGAGGPVPSASASAPGSESVQLTLSGATASSVVGDREMFNADKVFDGDLETCWQEGAADEKGQWIEVAFAPSRLDYVVVYAGYQLNHDAFRGNRRPENVLVSVDGGAPVGYLLADAEQPQRLDVDDRPGATSVRIEIVSTYDGVPTAYPGSPFDDLAISEIRAFGGAGE